MNKVFILVTVLLQVVLSPAVVASDDQSDRGVRMALSEDRDWAHAYQRDSTLLKLPRELLMKVMGYHQVAHQAANVCRRLERLRRQPVFGLKWSIRNTSALNVDWTQKVCPLPCVRLRFSPRSIESLVDVPNMFIDLDGRIAFTDTFASQIHQFQHLRGVSVREGLVMGDARFGLLEQLSKQTGLEQLSLSDFLYKECNQDRQILHLANLVNLSILRLEECRLNDQGAHKLSLLLPNFKQLRVLTLGRNPLSIDSILCLIKSLSGLHKLQKLSLRHSRLGDDGGEALAEVLPSLNNLIGLDLGYVHLGLKGARALAGALPKLACLEKLRLNRNPFGEEGVLCVIEACSRLEHIKKVVFFLHDFSESFYARKFPAYVKFI